jgi:hypothetical protein
MGERDKEEGRRTRWSGEKLGGEEEEGVGGKGECREGREREREGREEGERLCLWRLRFFRIGN